MLGVVTATDPQTQVSDTANGATLVGGYRLRLLGTPLRQCREGTIPRAAAPCLKALGQIQKVGAGVRPEPEAGCPQAPPTSWSVRGSPGGTLSGKAARALQLGCHMSQEPRVTVTIQPPNAVPSHTPAFQVLRSHTWLVATVLHGTDTAHFHCHRRSSGRGFPELGTWTLGHTGRSRKGHQRRPFSLRESAAWIKSLALSCPHKPLGVRRAT